MESGEEPVTENARNEHQIFKQLIRTVPGLEDRVWSASQEDILHTADLVSTVLDRMTPKVSRVQYWIGLLPTTALSVHLCVAIEKLIAVSITIPQEPCYVPPGWIGKMLTRTRQKLRSGEIIVSGDHWPIFLYQNYHYDDDEPWEGLLRSSLLVKAFKHIFTSPSSVDKEPKATRSGNARIHGMTSVTPGSLAYVATQVRFALTSSPIFSRTDTATDSERFYNSLLELLTSPDDVENIDSLIAWWNNQVFPGVSSTLRQPVPENSAWARIQKKRAALKDIRNRNSPIASQ